MTFQKQIKTIKENWLIIAIIGLLLIMSIAGSSMSRVATQSFSKGNSYDYVGASYDDSYSSPYVGYGTDNFAPEVETRKLTKNSNLLTKVERKEFESAYSTMKQIVDSYDTYLLRDNVNLYGQGLKEYHRGTFTIKVAEADYDSLIAQLKNIGKVQNFYETTQDITGSYTNLEVELAAEKSRLERFKNLLEESDDVQDKIELTDKIFDLERTISYYEKRLENVDQKIDYSTINFSIEEKQSSYANIAIVKVAELIRTLVQSFNILLYIVFFLAPWLLIILLVKYVWKKARK